MAEEKKGATTGKKGAKKVIKKLAPKSGKKGKRNRKESYTIYIYKLMKQIHHDTGISSKTMSIMKSFVNNVFECIVGEASQPAHYTKRQTISSQKIQSTNCLLPRRKLAKHTLLEA